MRATRHGAAWTTGPRCVAAWFAVAAFAAVGASGCYGPPSPEEQQEQRQGGAAGQARAGDGPAAQDFIADPNGLVPAQPATGSEDQPPGGLPEAVRLAARTAEPQPMPWQPSDGHSSGEDTGDPTNTGEGTPTGTGATTGTTVRPTVVVVPPPPTGTTGGGCPIGTQPAPRGCVSGTTGTPNGSTTTTGTTPSGGNGSS